MKKIWGKETDVSPAGRNEDKGKSRLLRDWEEWRKKAGNGEEYVVKEGYGGGESRNVAYVQMTNNPRLKKASLSVSGNQVSHQISNRVDNQD